MRRVELSIRSPTATAWLLCAITIIGTGELYYEIHTAPVAQLFGRPFTDAELLPVVGILGLLSLSSLVWLLSLYWIPGKISIDPDNQILSRRKLQGLRQTKVEEPLENWRIEITYFSEKDKDNRHFKKIVLGTTNYAEIILFSDLKRGEMLVETLSQLENQWGNYIVTIETR